MNPDTTPTPRWVIKEGDFDGKPYLWDDRKYDNYDLGTLCKILNEYEEKTNEVARLRELLNRAIEAIPDSLMDEDGGLYENTEHTKLKAELARLAPSPEEAVSHDEYDSLLSRPPVFSLKKRTETAPSPEEPVIQDSRITEPVSTPTDLNQQNKENTPSLNEWRELGPEEEIHTGDQVQAKHHDRLHGVWIDVFPYEVGSMPIDHEAFRYRTRRPLPVQKTGYCEPAPECPNCKNNTMVWQEKDFYNHWVCHRAGCGKPVGKPKQEETPLEKEIAEMESGRVVQIMPDGTKISENPDPKLKAVASAIRYLRDEVARLREFCERMISWIREDGYETSSKRFEEELAALAPTPEEPTCKKPLQDEPDPEWRELGPDEVICEGDEVQPKHHSRDGEWIKAWPYEIGGRSGIFYSMRYRTRRPLCPNDAPKQEEMPLDVIEKSALDMLSHENVFACLRYLRDEVQKLKNK